MLVLSMPSLLGSTLTPEGHQVLHTYLISSPMSPGLFGEILNLVLLAHDALKREHGGLLREVMRTVAVPDLDERVVLELQGTPRTHQRYLRVHQE